MHKVCGEFDPVFDNVTEGRHWASQLWSRGPLTGPGSGRDRSASKSAWPLSAGASSVIPVLSGCRVDHVVGAEIAKALLLVRAARRGDHPGTEELGELQCELEAFLPADEAAAAVLTELVFR
nr:hypothetical protein [Saccharothrix sp.]